MSVQSPKRGRVGSRFVFELGIGDVCLPLAHVPFAQRVIASPLGRRPAVEYFSLGFRSATRSFSRTKCGHTSSGTAASIVERNFFRNSLTTAPNYTLHYAPNHRFPAWNAFGCPFECCEWRGGGWLVGWERELINGLPYTVPIQLVD